MKKAATDTDSPKIETKANGSQEAPVFIAEKLDAFRRNIPTLTKAQRDVFEQLARGLTTNEIAEMLFVSVNTVRKHNAAIREKLGVKSLDELMVYIKWMSEGNIFEGSDLN